MWIHRFRIRIHFYTDPDPAFRLNTDPDPNFYEKKLKIFTAEKKIIFFFFQKLLFTYP
jgi:hypothetical protein